MNNLRTIYHKYSYITFTNIQNQLVYIWDTLNRAFFIVIIMIIFIQLWTVVFESQSADEIAGLTLANTIWYFLIAEMMELGKPRHDLKISKEVKDGSIAYTLLRPYNYLAYHFFNGLGESAVKMTFILLLGLPLVIYHAGLPTVNVLHLPLILIVVLGAMTLDFMAYSIIGLLAFVAEETLPFRLIYQKLVFILGGLMIPLDFLPAWLQPIARVLPFNLTTYAPAKLFVSFNWPQFWQIVGLQLIWIAVIGAILWRQYRWATTKLTINGG